MPIYSRTYTYELSLAKIFKVRFLKVGINLILMLKRIPSLFIPRYHIESSIFWLTLPLPRIDRICKHGLLGALCPQGKEALFVDLAGRGSNLEPRAAKGDDVFTRASMHRSRKEYNIHANISPPQHISIQGDVCFASSPKWFEKTWFNCIPTPVPLHTRIPGLFNLSVRVFSTIRHPGLREIP